MPVLQGFLVELQTDRAEVDGLTANHARRACRQRQGTDHLQADFGIRRAQAWIEQGAESQALQAVAGEDRAGFIEFLVGGWLAAAQIVIVHCWQIVMHQRVSVDQFHRTGRTVGLLGLTAQRLACGVGQQWTHAFAAIHHAVAHGFVQPRQLGARCGEQGFQRCIDAGLAGGRVRCNHSG
ncbi:hypothetical protein D9M69_508780 [compost metagenome]